MGGVGANAKHAKFDPVVNLAWEGVHWAKTFSTGRLGKHQYKKMDESSKLCEFIHSAHPHNLITTTV